MLQASGASVDANGNITPAGAAAGVMKDCGTVKGKAVCGYYQYLQGTSMASPHAAGVAALAVSAHGHSQGRSGFGLAPDKVRALVMGTATDHACPTPPLQSYAEVGRPATFDALCTGTADFNSFYGDGIVNALGVVADSTTADPTDPPPREPAGMPSAHPSGRHTAVRAGQPPPSAQPSQAAPSPRVRDRATLATACG